MTTSINKYRTPIHLACLTGNTEQIINMLKQDRHLVDARDHEDTPLHCAAIEAVARLLIEWKADVNARGWMAQTPLHVAAFQGHADIVDLLIRHGADVNARRTRGDTPLHWAANAEIAQILIEHGAVLAAQDSFGQLPFHWAARYAHADVVSLLLSHNADVHARDKAGKTPLFLAVGNRKSMSTIHLLLHAGADVNAQTSEFGSTPLHEAIWRAQSVERENEDIVRLLLKHGANVYTRDLHGKTPFHVAKHKPQLLAILSEHRERIGPPPALAPEQFVVEEIRMHPHKREAIALVKHAILARWALDHSPRLLTSTQTAYTRFNTLAVSPDGETIALAPAEEPVEFRRWADFSLLPTSGIPISNEATSLAFSPNGRWFALADRHEAIYLIDRTSGKVTAEIEGGEWTSPILFDPTSTILASACSFQGGGHVRLDKLSDEGQLISVYELWRSDINTPSDAFVDRLINLAFSPDGHWLALFETSSLYEDLRPSGWRGNIVLYNVETGTLQWQASIDAQVTGDKRSLKEAGYPLAFSTELLFVGNTEIACGATHGRVVFYDAVTGKLTRSVALPTDAAVHALALGKDDPRLWVVLEDGKLAVFPLF